MTVDKIIHLFSYNLMQINENSRLEIKEKKLNMQLQLLDYTNLQIEGNLGLKKLVPLTLRSKSKSYAKTT